MPQASKLLQSRQKWKEKAIRLGEQLRESRKAKKRYQNRIEDLKRQLKEERLKKNGLERP